MWSERRDLSSGLLAPPRRFNGCRRSWTSFATRTRRSAPLWTDASSAISARSWPKRHTIWNLFADSRKHHDARCADWRLEIKATMKDSLTFPADHVPELYLGIKLHADGAFDEIFNGPACVAREAATGRKPPKTSLHSVGIATLARLQLTMPIALRVARRQQHTGASG
jgi:hypothetical protein